MASYYCYIIYSHTLERFYTGVTHTKLSDRIEKHNIGSYGDHRYTSYADDWELFLAIPCATYSQAMRIERHIKRMKSSVYIRNLLKYPEMVTKLLAKYT